MTSHVLTRIRFPAALIQRIDALALELRAVLRRRVARASVIRVLVQLALDTAVAPELAGAVRSDNVRPGRVKGQPQSRRRR